MNMGMWSRWEAQRAQGTLDSVATQCNGLRTVPPEGSAWQAPPSWEAICTPHTHWGLGLPQPGLLKTVGGNTPLSTWTFRPTRLGPLDLPGKRRVARGSLVPHKREACLRLLFLPLLIGG